MWFRFLLHYSIIFGLLVASTVRVYLLAIWVSLRVLIHNLFGTFGKDQIRIPGVELRQIVSKNVLATKAIVENSGSRSVLAFDEKLRRSRSLLEELIRSGPRYRTSVSSKVARLLVESTCLAIATKCDLPSLGYINVDNDEFERRDCIPAILLRRLDTILGSGSSKSSRCCSPQDRKLSRVARTQYVKLLTMTMQNDRTLLKISYATIRMQAVSLQRSLLLASREASVAKS